MIMKKKLITAIFVAFVGCMTLAGCGNAAAKDEIPVASTDSVESDNSDAPSDKGAEHNREHSIDSDAHD